MSSFPVLALVCSLVVAASSFAANPQGLVDSAEGKNEVLLVGVSHGLPGIDLDIKNVERIASNPAYKFHPSYLEEEKGTGANTIAELTRVSESVGYDGTMFFYYSGHGSPGSLYLQDGSLTIAKMRKAMEAGRAKLGPMKRLVMMFDSCYSGSLLDPVRNILPLNQMYDGRIANAIMADEAIRQLSPSREEGPAAEYWKSLFVFASSRADETSLAGDDGSVFTVALGNGFDQTLESKGTLGAWVTKTQELTKGHHPVARFAPAELENEYLVP